MKLEVSEIEKEVRDYTSGVQDHQLALRTEEIESYVYHYLIVKSGSRIPERMILLTFQQIMNLLRSEDLNARGIQLYSAEKVVEMTHQITSIVQDN